jgi:integrase
MKKINELETLQKWIEHDNINLDDVADIIMQKRKKEFVKEKHFSPKGKPIAITQSKSNGRWISYYYDDDKIRHQLSKAKENEVYEFLYMYYGGEDIIDIKLKDVYAKWLDVMILDECKDEYIRKIKSHWKKFYLNSNIKIVNTPIRKITKDMLRLWIADIIDKYYPTQKEFSNQARIIRGCYDWAIEHDIVNKNLFEEIKVKPKRLKKSSKRTSGKMVFTQQMYKDLINECYKELERSSHRLNKLVPLGFILQSQIGARIGEVAALKYSNIDWEKKEIHIEGEYLFREHKVDPYTKGTFGDRIVPLSECAITAIKKAQDMQKKLGASTQGFILSLKDTPPSYSSFEKCYNKMFKNLGLLPKGTHVCRRQFISTLFDSDINPRTIQQLVGHNQISTTYNYIFDTNNDIRNQKVISALQGFSS